MGILKYGDDKGAHQIYLSSQRYVLSLQIDFSFVRAAVACAILERISG